METLTQTWQPILDGELNAQAQDATQSIVADLTAPQIAPSQENRKAGIALFLAYLTKSFPSQTNQSLVLDWLDQSIDILATQTLTEQLYGGFTEVAWVAEHIQNLGIGVESDADLNEEIDQVLFEYLSQPDWYKTYDLIGGLVGLGVYVLERGSRPVALECLDLILDHLEGLAEVSPQGITWFTTPSMLSANQQKLYPQGYYNLGVAHGVPGVIGLLGQICQSGHEVKRAKRLLDGAVEWMLAQKLADQSKSIFPGWMIPGEPPTPTRVAWCYGDLGIAAALLLAARSVGESAWEHQAIEIVLQTANRTYDQSGVIDAGLCHGAAGLVHLLNRMYQATGNTRLKQAACQWVEYTLRLRQPGEGIGGYFAYLPTENGGFGTIPDPTFLTGASGIGLALLAATTPVTPDWDRLLLASVPPRGSISPLGYNSANC